MIDQIATGWETGTTSVERIVPVPEADALYERFNAALDQIRDA